jgi:hypothetical protein
MAKIPFDPHRILSHLMSPASAMSFTGDLEERFHTRCETKNAWRAKVGFYREFIRSLPSIAAQALRAASAQPGFGRAMSVDCVPSTVRCEGHSEPVGKIRLRLRPMLLGAMGREFFGLKITLNCNITNRHYADGQTDISLVSGDGSKIAEAKRLAGNAIEFDNIALRRARWGRPMFITGIRSNASFGGERPVEARVELFASGAEIAALERRTVVGLKGHPVRVSICDVNPVIAPNAPDVIRANYSVKSFVVSFHAPFCSAFKTQGQEADTANNGTRLALQLSSVPIGCEVFVTACNLASEGADFAPKAVLVRTDANGRGREVISEAPTMTWENVTQMLPVRPAGLTCWEVVAPLSEADPAVLSFGVTVILPKDLPTNSFFNAAGALAPFYSTMAAHNPSATLPIPRFRPGLAPFNVPLA